MKYIRKSLDFKRNEAEHIWLVAEQDKNRFIRKMGKALMGFDCNIDFVNDTNPNKNELLKVLTYNLREALSRADGK
jgi:hypothetical protein